MKSYAWAFFFFCLAFSAAAQEKEQRLFLSGYVKNLHEFSYGEKLEQGDWTTLLHNRLNFKYKASEKISLRLEFRNRIFHGDRLKPASGFAEFISLDPGAVDLSVHLIENEELLFNSTLDRALINYRSGKWDLSLGRQRVNWGMNLVWNPNDIFNSYNFLDFDYEERPGADALKVQYYLTAFSKIELAAKWAEKQEEQIAAALYSFNKKNYDIQLLSGIYKKDWVLGTAWAGNIKDAGFKGELSYFLPYEKQNQSEQVLAASISFDYGFKKGLYVHASTLYNSRIREATSRIESLAFSSIEAKNLMPFRHSFFLQLAKDISPLVSLGASAIYSPTRHSFIAIPTAKYALAQNWEIDFTGQSFFELGEKESLGHQFILRLRYSF